MTQITEEVRDQLLEASAATRKAYNTYRREADPDDHYSAGEGAQSAADKSKDDLEMSAVISIMQPILRFLQLLCENHNRDLQVQPGSWAGVLMSPCAVTAVALVWLISCLLKLIHDQLFSSALQIIQIKYLYLAGQIQGRLVIQCSVVFSMYIKGGGINTWCGFLKGYTQSKQAFCREVTDLLLGGEGKGKKKSCNKIKRALRLWFQQPSSICEEVPANRFSWVFTALFMCVEMNTWGWYRESLSWSWIWWGTGRATRRVSRLHPQQEETRESMGLVLKGAEDLGIKDMERAKVVSATFTLLFTGKTGLHKPKVPETGGEVCSEEDLPLVEENWVRKRSNELDVLKPTAPGGMPQAPCGVLGPVLGSRVRQGVSKRTEGLEHLVGKERQRELGGVRLERSKRSLPTSAVLGCSVTGLYYLK